MFKQTFCVPGLMRTLHLKNDWALKVQDAFAIYMFNKKMCDFYENFATRIIHIEKSVKIVTKQMFVVKYEFIWITPWQTDNLPD